MTTLNRVLLLETLAYIEAHPENWNQGAWALVHPDKNSNTWVPDNVCNTAFCFAGRALVDNGWVPFLRRFELDHLYVDGESDASVFIPIQEAKGLRAYFEATNVWLEPKEAVYAELKAAELFGLDSKTATILFNGENTLEALRMMVADLLVYGELEGSSYDYRERAAELES